MTLLIIINTLSINEVVCSHSIHIFNVFGEEMFLAKIMHMKLFWMETFLSQQALHHASPVSVLSVKVNTKQSWN